MGYTLNAYLDTRIALLAKGITRPELLHELIDGDNSRFVALLHQLGIPGRAVESRNDEGGFEAQLHVLLLHEVTLLLRAIQGPLREFIIYWLRQYEVQNVKSLLRALAYGKKIDIGHIDLLDLGAYSSLSPETLLSGEDVIEILRMLERYGYSSLAQKARNNYEERQDVFELEAIIDRQYFDELMQRFRFLPEEQKTSLGPLVGMLLDRINLIWVLRYRINYGMESSHVYYLLAPQGHWLNKPVLMNMVAQNNLSDMRPKLPSVWRRALDGRTKLEDIENAAEQIFMEFTASLFDKTQEPIVRLVSYLWLRQRQLKQIAIINKGRRLDLGRDIVLEAAGLREKPEDEAGVDTRLNLRKPA